MPLFVGLTASAVAEQAQRARIADNDPLRPADRVFFTNNYFYVAVEGGFSSGQTDAGINNQREVIGFEKTFFGGDVAFGTRAPFGLVSGFEQAVMFGVRSRSYFGNKGDPAHAFIHYSRDWMVMPYVAMPTALGAAPGNTQFVITPFIGAIFEHGDLAIFNNQGRASVTRNGVGVGVNFDVLLPTSGGFQPFIGFGGQFSAMQSVNEVIDGFHVQLDDKIEARGVVRAGFFIR